MALDPGGRSVRATVGIARLLRPPYDCALWPLGAWLDSWAGAGLVAAGMHRRGFDLQLTQYDKRGATGTAWKRTPWHTGTAGGVGGLVEGIGRLMLGRVASKL